MRRLRARGGRRLSSGRRVVHTGPIDLLGFMGVSVLVIVTPGQDTALTIRNTLAGGRRGGVFTALGVVSGQAIWALATSAGVAALLLASEPAFDALRYAGAAYLAYLGLGALASAVRGHRDAPASDGSASRRLAPPAAYRQGLISNLGNAKIAVFFTSLLPQFAPASGPSFPILLGLGLLFAAMTLTWLAAYAAAVARAGDLLRRSRVRRALDAALGTTLVALGLRVATQGR